MMKRMVRIVLVLALTVVGVSSMACSQAADPEGLAGTQSHERHTTGIDSQVGDQ